MSSERSNLSKFIYNMNEKYVTFIYYTTSFYLHTSLIYYQILYPLSIYVFTY